MDSKREEERNEKIIRGMMKLPPNRRCINCNSLGPQYVCTNFWTFVCMPCSGIHREFTHRVKSVSMAKFTSQEVDALQKGGNQRARELFLSAWDPLRHRHPDNSNADKVREFIKNVYVDKKYAGKKPSDLPPTDSQGLKSHEDEMRRASSYHSYSQSPPYDFQYEERLYGKHALSLNRKPGSDRGLYGGKVFSFSSFSSPSRFSDHANDIQSPSSQRETWSPFSETLSSFSNDVHGHHAVPNSDANGGSNTGIIRHPQRTASSGSFGSFDSMSFKSVNSTGSQELAAEAKRSVDTSRDNIPSSHTPSPPQSSTSATFNGLDLFNEPFAPQNHTSSPTTVCSPQAQSVDLFQQSHISSVSALVEQKSSHTTSSPLNFTGLSQQLLVASTIGEASDVARPQNGGWASFDIFQNSLPMESQNYVSAAIPSSDGIYLGDSNPFLLGQSSFTQKSTSHEPSASAHTLWYEGEPTTNNSQLWNAFKDSPGKQPTENVLKDRDPVEALHNGGNLETSYVSEPISSGLSSHLSSVFHNFSMIPEVAGAHPVAAAHRTTNPFDLPCDAGLEPSSMTQFWDMSSLQVALPNNQMHAIYVGDANDSWFSQNSVSSYIPSGVTFDPPKGSLGFLVGQVPSAQISSAQSCVASVGGNPFA